MRRDAKVLACFLAGLTGCAAGQHRPTLTSVCALDVPGGGAQPTADQWFALLLHGYDPATGRLTGPALDCTGTPLAWQVSDDGCQPLVDRPLPPAKLTEANLRVESLVEGHRLVWAQVQRFPNGEVLGPVALVDSTPEGLSVQAMGSLRAEPDRVRLRLAHAGPQDVLWVESELCRGKGGADCHRAIRILPRRASRFIQEPLRTQDGACAGPAWFPIKRELRVREGSGWLETYELNTTVEPQPAQMVVHEQMVVREQDPKQDSPPRVLRKAQTDRVLSVNPKGMFVDEPSLWSRLTEEGANP